MSGSSNGHLDLAAIPMERRVRALRRALGWTQQELADEVGLNVRQIKRFEAGSLPSEESAHELARIAPRGLRARPELFFVPREDRETRVAALERKVELLERRLRKAGL